MNSNTCAINNHIPHGVDPDGSSKSVKPFSCAISNKYTPHDVVISILSKLPPRSLKKLSCVSKSWSLLPEDPYFMNMFRNNFVTSNCHSHNNDDHHDDDTCFFFQFEENGAVPYLVSGENRITLHWPPIFQGNVIKYAVLGYAINGTLCLSTYYRVGDRYIDMCQDKIVLWNPVTQEFKLIHPAPKPKRPHVRMIHGFGYDHVSDDYKVFQCLQFSACHFLWEIYSLRSKSWRTFELYIPFYPYFPSVHVYVNGVCHWLYWLGKECGKCVVSFDFSNEEFHVTPLPVGHASALACLKNHLVAINGSLALISNSQHSTTTFHISILDQLGVKESWIKLFTIGTLPDIQRVVGTGREGDILFRKKNGVLASLDLSTLMIKVVDVKGLSLDSLEIIIYKKSLLPIEGTNDD